MIVLPVHKHAAPAQRNRVARRLEQYLFPGTSHVFAITQPTCPLLSTKSTNHKEHPVFPKILSFS